ncbi:hypothetical protein PENSPDRAFT_647414 [Peniophora sp. CONT]|nr:hypothetical protein PENSPDRAFT_647414 [Peniophora sp. CONT]
MISIQVGWNGESPSTYRQRSSVVHGWLTKIRGTLIDNESERQKGIKEIKRAKKIQERGLAPKRPLLSLFSGSSKDQSGRTKGSKGTDAPKPIARRHTVSAPTRHASNTRPSGDAAKSGARPMRQSSSARPHHRPSGPSHRSSERPRAIDHRHNSERPRAREQSRERPRAIEPPKRRATTGGSHAPLVRRHTAPKDSSRPSHSNQVVVATRTPLRPPPPTRRPSAKRQ